jgi:3-oxoisoapionate decarboxylase
MTRRQMLATAALLPLAKAETQAPQMSKMGGAPTGFGVQMRAARQEGKTFDAVEKCHSLGLCAAETSLAATDAVSVHQFRQRAEGYNMRVVLNTQLPKTEADVPAFESAVKICKEAGAESLHAAMTQRRYEQFDSFAAWKKNFDQCQLSITLAEPVLRKQRMPLAIENHKGWRAAEQAAWMKRVSSEWVGVCLDFGNNIALCEQPQETFKLLLPFTIMCHIKDMGVASYEDGFLLSEVEFGEGVIPLKETVDTLRRKNPKMLFLLEMITRDPLKVPVLTDKYWVSFDDSVSTLPGRDLAKTLELVRSHPPRVPLPKLTGLTAAEQLKAEEDNNLKCIAYARKNLDL